MWWVFCATIWVCPLLVELVASDTVAYHEHGMDPIWTLLLADACIIPIVIFETIITHTLVQIGYIVGHEVESQACLVGYISRWRFKTIQGLA